MNPWNVISISELDTIDVLVISPGGAGTTMLLGEIAKFKKTNCLGDTDGFKHLPYNAEYISRILKTKKIIYLYDRPERVVNSIAHRGWLRVQGSKLGSILCVFLPEGFQKRFFYSAVIRQINGYTSKVDEQLLILQFDHIWDSLEEISNFLEVDTSKFVFTFPPRKERKSDNGCANR